MTGQPGPRVLVVTSSGAPPAVVTPVLAALEAHGLSVRALDVGRVGSRASGAAWRMLRAIVGELAERRLQRELEEFPPDVALSFDPGTTAALSAARDHATAPAPVVAVVPELEPAGDEWADTGADRYLTVDDHAAVALADGGIEGERVLPIGPFCPLAYAEAGREPRAAVRARFKLPASEPVVLVEVAGLGGEVASQLALQLSLIGQRAAYLFAAGDDADAATALRRQVPTLGLRAKLFGHTTDAPLLWRTADVVVARPRPSTVARAMAVGARLVALSPDEAGRDLVGALEARGMGLAADGPLFVSSALEPLLAARTASEVEALAGEDGAANVADVAWIVGRARREIVDQARSAERAHISARVAAAARAAASAARSTAAAGDLEDLGGGDDAPGPSASSRPSASAPPEPEPPDPVEMARLRRELESRAVRAQRTVTDAQQSAARWDKKADEARGLGSESAAREASRNADLERSRMHAALAELAQLSAEREALEKAARAAPRRRPQPSPGPTPPPVDPFESERPPPRAASRGPTVDELLEDLKRGQGARSGPPPRSAGAPARPSGTVDDELEALKRKMSGARKGKP